MSLKGKTLFITGASRGIGKAIALRAARDGANIVIAARTEEPGGKLPGTIQQTSQEVFAAGGKPLALPTDVRNEESVEKAVAMATTYFGGIDILVNNAGAISPTNTFDTSLKLFDIMMATNVRAAFLCAKTCLPYLVASAQQGRNPHVLNLTPPLNMRSSHLLAYAPYTVSKYGMSILTIAMAGEFSGRGIAVNGLWPRKVIATDALRMIKGIDSKRCRRPEIMADAAYAILNRNVGISGTFFTDEIALNIDGTADFSRYAVVPGTPDDKLVDDLFLD